ncbi:MAG: ATP-binding protein [Bacteroidales bacterium]|nr:ATP-binding protein [Bacteroidales bacterium]
MLIKRPDYFDKLLAYKDKEPIKVITGVRRSGKSSLLLMWKEFLEENQPASDVIYLSFEHPSSFKLHEGAHLMDYLQSKTTKEHVYFLFDEIQFVSDWQKYINGLRLAYNCDIYLTGSNSELLAGELATLLTGRYVEIAVFPLSFKEYLSFRGYEGGENKDLYFRDYLDNGGFPLTVMTADAFVRDGIMRALFDSVLFRDVVFRGAIQNPDQLMRVVSYLMDNIGNPLSASSIANYLTSAGFKTYADTISRYLHLLEQAYTFYRVERYDIRGKERLKTLGKYYAVDLGLRNYVLGRTDINRGSQIENLVFLRLLQAGYKVFVGKYDDKEVDFVCFKGKTVKYIQVCERLPVDNDREIDNLLLIRDNYDRLVVTMNTLDVGSRRGIDIIHIYDFLLADDGSI